MGFRVVWPATETDRVISAMKKIVILAVLSLSVTACIRLAHLEKTPPTRTMEFTGDYTEVAQCVHGRVGGKVRKDPFKKRIAVFDAVNFLESQGVSHYALIFIGRPDGGGVAEFRKRPEGPIENSMITRFWAPVEQCIKQAASS